MIYVDTSVLVALVLREATSDDVDRWYRKIRVPLVSSRWCVTEFASALGIKQRTGQVNRSQAGESWQRFGQLMANEFALIDPAAAQFQRAALLALDAENVLRAGDALHLASAEQSAAQTFATLDRAQGKVAQRLKFKVPAFA